MNYIEARNITFSRGAARILENISLVVGQGRFIGIIGPNGSGKSTFLQLIYRVLNPNGGSITLEGKPLTSLSHRESALKLAVVAQHNQYDFDFSVRDVVLMGRSPHKKLMERDSPQDFTAVRQALKQVGLSDLEERPFASLSGGEQQRVILARALAQDTPALVLDEPTNHLDIKYQLDMLNTVRRMQKTVVAAFHDLNIAAMYCDEIYVLRAGRVYAAGSPAQVLTSEMIRSVYGVNAAVHIDVDGQLYVTYKA